MSEQEIKVLVMELAESIQKLKETVDKINANYLAEKNKGNYNAPLVFSVYIDGNIGEAESQARAHISDILKTLEIQLTKTKRGYAVYPIEKSVCIGDVKLYELSQDCEDK